MSSWHYQDHQLPATATSYSYLSLWDGVISLHSASASSAGDSRGSGFKGHMGSSSYPALRLMLLKPSHSQHLAIHLARHSCLQPHKP